MGGRVFISQQTGKYMDTPSESKNHHPTKVRCDLIRLLNVNHSSANM